MRTAIMADRNRTIDVRARLRAARLCAACRAVHALNGIDMLTLTKQDSIVIAITLGLALGAPMAIPAFYTTSNITIEDREAPPLSNSNPVEHLAKRKVPHDHDMGSTWQRSGVDDGMYEGMPTDRPPMSRL
jgi:hypothetical protein